MKKVLVLNGPNLNMLGLREPEIYGPQSLNDIEQLCIAKAQGLKLDIDFKQSNHEGELVCWIQQARENTDGIIINAAAYTHTSVAIHDALKLHDAPIIEVHISDPKKREKFRHFSFIEPLATEIIAGQGVHGYEIALDKLAKLLYSKT